MRLARLINHAHSAAGQLVQNLVIRDVPVAVARLHAGEHFLEGLFARWRLVFLERVVQQTIET